MRYELQMRFGPYYKQPVSNIFQDKHYCAWLLCQREMHIANTDYQLQYKVEVRNRILLRFPDLFRLVPKDCIKAVPAHILQAVREYQREHLESHSEEEEDDVYEVEAILGHEEREEAVYYLIKWKGYSTEENTWEPSDHVSEDLKKEYWNKKRRY